MTLSTAPKSTSPTLAPSASHEPLAAKLDRCVMCGMCSQHCPTYQLTGDENESPRGRIALIAALNSGQLAVDARVQSHLEHCTGCRACEAYCPSEVKFGAIIHEAKTLLPAAPPATSLSISLHTGRWLRRYQRWGLQKVVRASGVLNLLGLAQKEQLLPEIPDTPDWQTYYPATDSDHRGDVALFTGCIANVFDREALDASRRLLNALGYGVHVPATQGCCGAMALHSGQQDEAAALAQQNLDAFAGLEVQAIVHTASGCTAQLSEYHLLPALAENDRAAAHAFSARVKDISQFLTEIDWPDHLQAAPLATGVALHTPCSLKNVLHQGDAARRLLQRIPEIEIASLPATTRCCGGAGQYMLEQREFAQQLRARTLDALDQLDTQHKIDTLATSNLGCALHLAAGLRERGQPVTVTHPVVLVARQLGLTARQPCTPQACTPMSASAKVAS